ncbi:MAG: serine/threonine protein phosphatase [Acetobacteraceae bacterium]|nr:serine/threonine protein phosphatase [Acetobacteraceae bacterium]
MDHVATAPATLPEGQRIYAIGDVHGCAGRLLGLHRRIIADLAARPVARPVVVHLGDFVDRGPDSAAVIDALAGLPSLGGAPVVNLRGNHEEMMLAAMADPSAVDIWLYNGGLASLSSWEVPPGTPSAQWPSSVPADHLAFLNSLRLSWAAGPYFFAHAGVRPGIPLARQAPHDLLWIREPFLGSSADFGAVVVHGHTPQPDPVIRPNRLGIDTGAVLGGKLTCAVLEGNRIGFLFG